MPGSPGSHRTGRQLHLIRDVAGFDEAEPLAGLRRNVNGVSEFRLLLLQIGDLRAQPLLARRQLRISVRWPKYVRTGPAIVSVSTQTTAARMAARRAAEPNRCSDCCSAASAIDCRIESAVRLLFGLRLGP